MEFDSISVWCVMLLIVKYYFNMPRFCFLVFLLLAMLHYAADKGLCCVTLIFCMLNC